MTEPPPDGRRSRPPGPPDELTARLATDELEVVVLTGKGADVHAVIDRASGIDVLFKPPWGWREPSSLPTTGLDEAGWLDRYAGGWQLLLPNAGRPRQVAGAIRGYHGEASLLAWTVEELAADRLAVSAHLTSAPLRVRRVFQLRGRTLAIHTQVANDSEVDVEVMWVEHPVFGADFVDGRSRLHCDAKAFLADADDPGGELAAGALAPVLGAVAAAGPPVDLRVLPDHDARRKVFGALTGFTDGGYEITSPTAGFGVRMRWDPEFFPHAWLWQECHASTGFPWFGRAYAVAVEPANVLPGDGESAGLARGAAPVLAGGSTLRSWVELSTFALTGA